MNDINKGNYEALAGEYEEQQTVLREEQELKAKRTMTRPQILQLWKNLHSPKPTWEEFKWSFFADDTDAVKVIIKWREKNKANSLSKESVDETFLVVRDGVVLEEDTCTGNCAERSMVEKEMNPDAKVDIVSTKTGESIFSLGFFS